MPVHEVPDITSLYMVGIIGLFVGGIASYLADRLLFEEGYKAPLEHGSYCSHRGSLFDAIPFLSLLLLNGKCKNCRRKVTWQYLFSELLTAIFFVLVARHFGLNIFSAGMMFFISVLVAICITDFKAKIIPHELTYPAIILGVIFSALTKSDVLGALAGIGVSYILFDFLAFYGLKFFLWVHPPSLRPAKLSFATESKRGIRQKKAKTGILGISREAQPVAKKANRPDYPNIQMYSRGMPVEELEIIGGGDAVLSALISAWLGWQKLVVALLLGFLVGTVLGAFYVLVELRKERMLQALVFPVLICMTGLSILAASLLFMLATSLKESLFLLPYQYILPGAAVIGALLGVIIAGSKISKPFPFGPALAIGAIIAIFRQD